MCNLGEGLCESSKFPLSPLVWFGFLSLLSTSLSGSVYIEHPSFWGGGIFQFGRNCYTTKRVEGLCLDQFVYLILERLSQAPLTGERISTFVEFWSTSSGGWYLLLSGGLAVLDILIADGTLRHKGPHPISTSVVVTFLPRICLLATLALGRCMSWDHMSVSQ